MEKLQQLNKRKVTIGCILIAFVLLILTLILKPKDYQVIVDDGTLLGDVNIQNGVVSFEDYLSIINQYGGRRNRSDYTDNTKKYIIVSDNLGSSMIQLDGVNVNSVNYNHLTKTVNVKVHGDFYGCVAGSAYYIVVIPTDKCDTTYNVQVTEGYLESSKVVLILILLLISLYIYQVILIIKAIRSNSKKNWLISITINFASIVSTWLVFLIDTDFISRFEDRQLLTMSSVAFILLYILNIFISIISLVIVQIVNKIKSK